MAVDDRLMELNRQICVVLGGSGFVGRSLVLRLLKLGNWIVRIADSPPSIQVDHPHHSLLARALSSGRASYFSVLLRDKRQITEVIEGSSVVFYMDHAVDMKASDFYGCYMHTVQGTKNVINACRECRVKRLIYNSSVDVVFDGLHDIHDGDESLSHPSKGGILKIENMLSDLKAQAEAMVVGANDIDGLSTCALRASNVFGPGDSELVPFILKLGRSGWAKFIIGSGDNLSDFTYSENLAHALICAEEALHFQTVSVAGKAFFITNFEPMKFWKFISLILEGLGYQRPLIKLPVKMVRCILLLVKWAHENMGSRYFSYPLLVHFFHLASHTRTFNCTAAKKDIGYLPVVSLEEGISSTVEAFSHLAKDSYHSRDYGSIEQSKAEKLLGGGKVADILLWRDETASFTYFIALVMLFHWFFLSGRTFTSSVARLLLLSIVILYGYGILPSNIFGFTIQRMALSSFEISEKVVKGSVATTVYLWNMGFQNIKILAQGSDWSVFFKVTISLLFLKLILSEFLMSSIGIALVFAFTAFFVYEQYESGIDGTVRALLNSLQESMTFFAASLPDSLSPHGSRPGHEG